MENNTDENLLTNELEPSQQLRLISVLYALEEEMQKQNSLKHAFLRGLIYGLGTVIGATILLALFGSIIATTINSIGSIPYLGELIKDEVSTQIDNGG